ncbi:MAG: hypothetical protein KDA91_16265, partial [Planctomycetaceae bacterium]|nr:hypothetical protein [Planctomycetaceae bacterium]
SLCNSIGLQSIVSERVLITVPWLISTFSVLVMAVVVFGWSFSIAAIGVDQCGSGDAMSRGISYCLSHKTMTVVCFLLAAMMMVAIGSVFQLLGSDGVVLTQSISVWAIPDGSSITRSDFHVFVKWLKETVQLSIFFAIVGASYIFLRYLEDGVAVSEMQTGSQR